MIVAIIDSGIDRTVPALRDRLWLNPGEIPGNGIDDDRNGYVDDINGWDFRDRDPGPSSGTPIYWHGTFVAGLVAAAFDARSGVGGVAPAVRIMDLRFLDSQGLFYTSDWKKLVQAIDYAVDNGARVINLSIYAKATPPDYVHASIRRAVSRGTVVVAIAGNTGGEVGPLGRYPEVITVGAVGENSQPAFFSSRGPEVNLSAPGVGVTSYGPGGELRTGSGTSFAAPHVAGTVALAISLNPKLAPADIKALIQKTARDIASPGQDPATGAGLVDAAATVASLVPQH